MPTTGHSVGVIELEVQPVPEQAVREMLFESVYSALPTLRKPSYVKKPNTRSLMIGPPTEPPNSCCWCVGCVRRNAAITGFGWLCSALNLVSGSRAFSVG